MLVEIFYRDDGRLLETIIPAVALPLAATPGFVTTLYGGYPITGLLIIC